LKCPKCFLFLERKEYEKHRREFCGKRYCLVCRCFREINHRFCFVSPYEPKHTEFRALLFLLDTESDIVSSNIHQPNLLVVQNAENESEREIFLG
jgi:hypothetical protein